MTVEAVCERVGRRQFEEGEDIFAVQWSGIHKMAQTGDIRGLRYDRVSQTCCVRTVTHNADMVFPLLLATLGRAHLSLGMFRRSVEYFYSDYIHTSMHCDALARSKLSKVCTTPNPSGCRFNTVCCTVAGRFFLEDNNTPPNIRDDRGDTPLNVAAYAGQPAAVEELLRQGANINAKNNKARAIDATPRIRHPANGMYNATESCQSFFI